MQCVGRFVAMLLIFLLPVPQAMADGTGCAELMGNGVRAGGDIPGEIREGALRLSDHESVALFDHKGKRIFGSLSIVPFRRGYEAFWKPISGTAEHLVVPNGTHQAALVIRRDED